MSWILIDWLQWDDSLFLFLAAEKRALLLSLEFVSLRILCYYATMHPVWRRYSAPLNQRVSLCAYRGKTDLYPYRRSRCLQVLLSLWHQDGLIAGEHWAVAVCWRVSFSCHDSGCLHGYGHGLCTVQAVGGVVQASTWVQPQAEAVRGPHPPMRVPPVMVGILRRLSAALGCDGDEGFGGGAWWDRRRGLLVVGCVGDGWKRWKKHNCLKSEVECENKASLKCQLFLN